MLTREMADRLIRLFESMSEADRDALLERAGVQGSTALDTNEVIPYALETQDSLSTAGLSGALP